MNDGGIIGRTGFFSIVLGHREFRPAVRVTEVRHAYGRTRHVIEPVVGEGQAVVGSSRVELDEYVPINEKVTYDGGGKVTELETKPVAAEEGVELFENSEIDIDRTRCASAVCPSPDILLATPRSTSAGGRPLRVRQLTGHRRGLALAYSESNCRASSPSSSRSSR